MAKCLMCKIEILDEAERCPLCSCVLEPEGEMENMYPDVRLKLRRLNLLSRICLFVFLVAEVCWLTVDFLRQPTVWWSAVGGLVMLYLYSVLRLAILGKRGYRGKIVALALIAVVLSVAVDVIIGYRGWSVDYVLPAGVLLIDGIILGCMIWNRRNWQSYIMWQLFTLLFSLLPPLLYRTELGHNFYLALLPPGVTLALFLGTMIIGDRRARLELRRRFHIN